MKTKHIQYETHGTCSKLIDVTADENDVIQQVFFLGGCNGNLQGISQLVLEAAMATSRASANWYAVRRSTM